MPVPSQKLAHPRRRDGEGAEDAEAQGRMSDFAEVYQSNANFVWRVVARMGVASGAIPDVVQDVFLVVHRRLPDYDHRASIRAWLAGICRGVVRNHHRAVSRRERRLKLLPTPDAAAPDVERLELGKAVSACLDELDEEQRMALLLTDIEGLSPNEVAQSLGVSRNTIYSRIRLARKKLRRRLLSLGFGAELVSERGVPRASQA